MPATDLQSPPASSAYAVTGPTSGIGRATAFELAKHGMVVLIGRDAKKLEDVQKAIENKGGRATSVVCDLSDISSVRRAAAEIIALHLPIAGLLNNEGISREGELIALGEKYGIVEKSGNTYKFGEQKLAVGYDATRTFLRENKSIAIQSGSVPPSQITRISEGPATISSPTAAGTMTFPSFNLNAGNKYSIENLGYIIFSLSILSFSLIVLISSFKGRKANINNLNSLITKKEFDEVIIESTKDEFAKLLKATGNPYL